ncbi:hypothetical protein ACF0H5_019029 [Mactra antiquata]
MGDPLNPLKGLFLLFMYSIATIEGEIRCYCNESGCVTTNYMCKSQLGMCYTHIKYKDSNMDPSQTTIVSGCADTLQQEPRMRTCVVGGDTGGLTETVENITNENVGLEIQETVVVGADSNIKDSDAELLCCTLDMCNYRGSNELSVIIDQAQDRKGTPDGMSSKRTYDTIKPQKDLWFKAAVIAVPIAGGFILILLVLLAVRMLKTDSRQHKRLIQIRRERSLTKAQLYVTDHFNDKEQCVVANENQIYTGTSDKTQHSHVVHQCNNSKRDVNHSHKNNNHHHHHHHHHHKHGHNKVTTHRDGHTYEQIVTQNSESNSNNSSSSVCDQKCSSSRTVQHPSMVVWGKSNQMDTADAV